jgi:hypothetical protein
LVKLDFSQVGENNSFSLQTVTDSRHLFHLPAEPVWGRELPLSAALYNNNFAAAAITLFSLISAKTSKT